MKSKRDVERYVEKQHQKLQKEKHLYNSMDETEECKVEDCSKKATCFIHTDNGIEAYCLTHYKKQSIENNRS